MRTESTPAALAASPAPAQPRTPRVQRRPKPEPLDARAELRVKIKNLADEARTIRVEEERALARGQVNLYRRLRLHRIDVVRPAARVALLAYALIRGVPYRRIEPTAVDLPPFAEVRKQAERFGLYAARRFGPKLIPVNAAAAVAQDARFDAWIEDATHAPRIEVSAPAEG